MGALPRVSDDGGSSSGGAGLPGNIRAWAAAIAAVIAIPAGYYAYQKSRNEANAGSRCTVSGRVTDSFSGDPVGRVRVGFASEMTAETVIATSAADGTYSGNCDAARPRGPSVELYTARPFPGAAAGGPALPCLRSRDSGVRIDTEGKHEDVALTIAPQC